MYVVILRFLFEMHALTKFFGISSTLGATGYQCRNFLGYGEFALGCAVLKESRYLTSGRGNIPTFETIIGGAR